jgi:hypothetical protein
MKKSGMGWQEWHYAYELEVLPPCKFKIHAKTYFASKIILFQMIIELKHVIVFCYGRQ